MRRSNRLTHYPPNPAYGSGVCRRRFCFSASPARMTVSLLDDFHDMILEIEHDGNVITNVRGKMHRFPKTTCAGAIGVLQAFVGLPVTDGRAGLVGHFSHKAQCTHLADMAILGVSAITRGVEEACVELALSDLDAHGFQSLVLHQDGKELLNLRLQHESIIAPAEFAGQPMFGGFNRWADERFSGFERDLWHMSQMLIFVAYGRKYIVDGPQQFPARGEPEREGACYSYRKPAFEVAQDNMNYVRDYSHGLPPRPMP